MDRFLRIREAVSTDSASIAAIDAVAFPNGSFPTSYFQEVINFTALKVLVAVAGDDVIGYTTLFRDRRDDNVIYLGSVAVAPEHRRKGVANELLSSVESEATKARVGKIRLLTSPLNAGANLLYQQRGYRLVGEEKNYFGPGEDRNVYELTIKYNELFEESTDRASLLSDEASAGISFSNVLTGISTATVGLIMATPPSGNIFLMLAAAVLMLISSIYATLCYANTHGILRANPSMRSVATVPILWGNALSEYLGVYIVNVVIVGAVLAYSSDIFLTRIAYVIVSLGFTAYVVSEVSLLSRSLTNRFARLAAASGICMIGIAAVELIAAGNSNVGYLLGSSYLAICLALLLLDLREQHLLIISK